MGKMRSLVGLAATALGLCVAVVAQSSEKFSVINADGPTVIAFFPRASSLQPNDDSNEALADFGFYWKSVSDSLGQMGIKTTFEDGESFYVRTGGKTTLFTPKGGNCGFYLVERGKQPRLLYGVMTDSDLLYETKHYFGLRVSDVLRDGPVKGKAQTADVPPRAEPLPKVVKMGQVYYPPLALRARITGDVRVKVTTDGERVVIAEAVVGHSMLKPAAVDMVHTWQFEPHVPMSFEVTLHFKQSGDSQCDALSLPVSVRVEAPNSVTIDAVPPLICDPSSTITRRRRWLHRLWPFHQY